MSKHGISQRRASRLVGVDPKTVRAERAPDCPEIRRRMREIAAERRRFGYRRIGLMLLVLSAAGLRAEPAVVIGSFADVQNASALQQAASSLELLLPVREIRTVAYDGGAAVLHRVVVLPLDASETPKLLARQVSP